MDKTEKNRPKIQEVREQWIRELAPLFFKRGFKALTIDDVARHLGVSKATLYKQFSSRDDLFHSVIMQTIDDIRTETEKVLFNKEMTFLDIYIQHKKILLYWIENISNIMLEDIQTHFPKLRKEILSFLEEQFEIAKDFFSEGIKEGNIIDVNPAIIARHNLLFFSYLFQGNFLQENGLTLKQAFIDFTLLTSYGQLYTKKENPETESEGVSKASEKMSFEEMRTLLEEEWKEREFKGKNKKENTGTLNETMDRI